jgi:hypothetical protein
LSVTSNTIVTSNPPLNLFEVNRVQLQGNSFFTILDVPKYIVPATALRAQYTINTAAIMTGLTITNLKGANNTASGDITASVRIIGIDGGEYYVVNKAPVPANDFIFIGLDRQVLLSGERLQVSCASNANTSSNDAVVHFSFIINQRETFTEVV